jgi:hypothetical protein
VTEQTWADWCQLRKARRAPVTQTVIDAAAREAAKAGLDLEAFLAIWCLRGSAGLQASWLKDNERAGAARSAKHAGFQAKNYRDGIASDGSFS